MKAPTQAEALVIQDDGVTGVRRMIKEVLTNVKPEREEWAAT